MSFWETKKLAEMTAEEWESLCDNCGKCCLHKLEDEDTGKIVFTSVACRLINLNTCRCTRYNQRTKLVAECLDIRKLDVEKYNWLPSTCAYRLLNEGKELPSWHPLLTGSPASVKRAGVSISSYAIKESMAMDLEDHIIEWLN
ncbi:MAG: YcgN family cysteine cluster protein [Methylococcales bacterium]|nr:YcgN family cysteine cluster protein [Methylococcales bacterium]MDD5630792.1 YcgN family cysteine cluster protein [Methylococcales bacterium]